MDSHTEQYRAIIYECANALSPEAIEHILQDPLSQDPQRFGLYLHRFVQGELPTAEMTLGKKKPPRPATLEKIWRTWQTLCQNAQRDNILLQLAQQLAQAPLGTELSRLITALDPLETVYEAFDYRQPQRIAEFLTLLKAQLPELDPEKFKRLDSLVNGATRGLEGSAQVNRAILDWLYEPQQARISFGQSERVWRTWGRRFSHPFLKEWFDSLADGRLREFLETNLTLLDDALWLELALVLRYTEVVLLNIFEERVMSKSEADRMAVATYLTFIGVWSELGFYLATLGSPFAPVTYQASLQVLKQFAQRPYFPLYGPILVSLGGAALGEALTYLKEPLHTVEDTPEMAKIYNLLGCALRYQGQEAARFFDIALDLAQRHGETLTEAACCVNRGYALAERGQPLEAIGLQERALVLTRTVGHRVGEAHALVALGHSLAGLYRFSEAMDGFNRGVALARDLGELPAVHLGLYGISLVYNATERYGEAAATLAEAREGCVLTQDLGLLGQVMLMTAEVQKALQKYKLAVSEGVQALFLLHRLQVPAWRRAGGLLVVLRGQLGAEPFDGLLREVCEELAPRRNLHEEVHGLLAAFNG